MQGTDWPVTRAEVFQGWLQEILTPQQIDGFNRDKEFDGSHAFPFVRMRINLMDSLRGPAMVEAGRIDGDQAMAVSLKPNELAQALRTGPKLISHR